MNECALDKTYTNELAAEHRAWLNSFDHCQLDHWKRLLNENSEAAYCEAAVRRLLVSFSVSVEPYERLKADGVDLTFGVPGMGCLSTRKLPAFFVPLL